MSYDLMVFEPSAAPKSEDEFMEWYDEQTEWSEDHNYQDHTVASKALQNWYMEMIKEFPPMNGPLASRDNDDHPGLTSYSIGRYVIYSGFSWGMVEEAYSKVRELATKYSVGFFDVSSGDPEIIFPS